MLLELAVPSFPSLNVVPPVTVITRTRAKVRYRPSNLDFPFWISSKLRQNWEWEPGFESKAILPTQVVTLHYMYSYMYVHVQNCIIYVRTCPLNISVVIL